jgi:hypothetical protein
MEQLDRLKLRLGNEQPLPSDELLSEYLSEAEAEILNRLFPFGDGDEELPAKYYQLQVEIAEFLVLKRGAEYETTHNENGVNRHYGENHIPENLLRQITPYAKVVG